MKVEFTIKRKTVFLFKFNVLQLAFLKFNAIFNGDVLLTSTYAIPVKL